MSHKCLVPILATALSGASLLSGQVTLNLIPSRVVGHSRLQLTNGNPNLVEGRELYSPQGIAVDTSANPPILYVADTGNNRVMVWKNAAQFGSGAAADLIIGQNDPYSTLPLGPGTSFSVGLSNPTGLAVKDGDLYVADTGNNRILRFPKPTTQQDQFPNMVIGQPNFKSRDANQGYSAPGKTTIALSSGSASYRASLAFDLDGNLWITDPGNHRVLRYPAQAIAKGDNAPEANLVVGQVGPDSVAAPLAITAANQQVKDRLQYPDSLVFDSRGNLYVSDALSRVLAFAPPFRDNMPAFRILGVVAGAKTQVQADRTVLVAPQGLFTVGGTSLGVVDSGSSRVVVFDPSDQWPAVSEMISPQARYIVGQGPSTYNDFSTRKVNNAQPEANENSLSGPAAAVLAGGELFIADAGNHRVLVMPQQGGYFGAATRVLGQDRFSSSSANLIEGREFDFTLRSSSGNFADAAVVVDQHSDTPHLYVADTYNNRVLGFNDARGVRPGDRADIVIGQPDMYRSLCNYPSNDPDKPTSSGLCRPVGLAIDDDGNLWVADSANGRVLRFPSPFANPASLPAADLVLGQSNFTIKITDPTARTMATPYGLAFAGDAGLLVSDPTLNRVLLFSKKDGSFANGATAVKVFGQSSLISSDASAAGAPEDNRLRAPRHIAADTEGRLYVADTGNNRIVIFDQVAYAPNADARAAVTLGSLSAPRGLYVSPQTGEFWVTDSGNNRVLHFPRYDFLPFNGFQSDKTITAPSTTLAVTQDQYGDLLMADATNRVAIYYPALKAVNGAHQLDNRALSPGMVAFLFPQTGGSFGGDTADVQGQSSWPKELADTQVLVNDEPAPLAYVSPGQINIQVPGDAPAGGTAEFQVLRKSTGQILATGTVPMNVASPGLFTVNKNGTGQVVASNQDGSANSASNRAARGSVISLFGTGVGVLAGAPPDGEAAASQTPTADKPRVFMGICYVDESRTGLCEGEPGSVVYSGLAPGLVGTWQIDVKIPKWVAPDSSVPVFVLYKGQYSNGGDPASARKVATTVAVKE